MAVKRNSWQCKNDGNILLTFLLVSFFCFSDPGVYIFPDILGGCNSSLPNNNVNSVIKKSPFARLVEINLYIKKEILGPVN